MSFNISLNLRPSIPLPDFANLTIAVNDINENMMNNMIPTIKVIVNALENVATAEFGTFAMIMVRLFAPLAIASELAYTIFVNDLKRPLAEATTITMIKGMMK